MKQKCPQCHQEYEFDPSKRGQIFSCLECGNDFIITQKNHVLRETPAPKSKLPLLIGGFCFFFVILGIIAFLFCRNDSYTELTGKQDDASARKLVEAIRSGDSLQSARLLRGHDLKKYGWMFLAAAVESNNQEMIQTLLASGIDLAQCKGPKGEICLHIAVGSGNFELFKFLVQKGAPLDAVDERCDTLWGMAAERGFAKVLEYLAVSQQYPQDNANYEKSIFRALRKGHTECVKILMDKYNVNEFDKQENTILMAAFQENNVEIAKYALARQANITLANQAGESVCFVALKNKNSELIDLIDFQTVNLNTQTKDGTTLPMICVKAGNYEFLPKVTTPQNVNMADQQGKTAIYYACEKNDITAINILWRSNPSIETDDLEKSPVYIALIKKSADAIEMLNNRKVTFNSRQQDQEGNNLLMLAAATGDPQIFDCFSLSDFDLFHKNKSGETVLDIAVRKNAPYKNRLLEKMDAANLQYVSREVENISKLPLNEQIGKIRTMEQQMQTFPRTRAFLADLRYKLETRLINRETDNVARAIRAAQDDRYYESAIKTLQSAIAANPRAKNLNEARILLLILEKNLNEDKRKQLQLEKKRAQIKRMSTSQLESEIRTFIDSWLADMRMERPLGKYYFSSLVNETFFNVKSWSILGPRDGTWSHFHEVVIISVESTNKAGIPIRVNWKVSLLRDDGMQWKISGVEQ